MQRKATQGNSCSNRIGTIKKTSDQQGWGRNGGRVWVGAPLGAAIVENRKEVPQKQL